MNIQPLQKKVKKRDTQKNKVHFIYKFDASPFITIQDNAFVIFMPFPNQRLRIKSFEVEPNKEYEILAISIDYIENKLIPKLREQFTPQDE